MSPPSSPLRRAGAGASERDAAPYENWGVEDYRRRCPHAVVPRHVPNVDGSWGIVLVTDARPAGVPDVVALAEWQHGRCGKCRDAQRPGELASVKRYCHYTEMLFCLACLGNETRVGTGGWCGCLWFGLCCLGVVE